MDYRLFSAASYFELDLTHNHSRFYRNHISASANMLVCSRCGVTKSTISSVFWFSGCIIHQVISCDSEHTTWRA